MKKVVFLLVTVMLGAIIISAALVISCLPVDSVRCFDWTGVCHSAVVSIYLTTDTLWVTNHTYKITFLFVVENISGCPNATIIYDNSHILLNNIKIDPGYLVDINVSPHKRLSEEEGWSADWYFTPKADDHNLACMGISKGKRIKYPLTLKVNYTVVDSEGVEWPCLSRTISGVPPDNFATVTIVGGEDAP